MFIEKHEEHLSILDSGTTNKDYNTLDLAFIKSSHVQAYPCGRRRSMNIAEEGKPEKRLPFDPEARLNTESNNRKHSSLNGYTQTYLKEWDEAKGIIDISLAGYLFSIKPFTLDTNNIITPGTDYRTSAQFASGVLSSLGLTDSPTITKIYANIVIEDVHLFSTSYLDTAYEYYTGVLRKQEGISTLSPDEELDLLCTAADGASLDKNDFDNYYFSGLSFSVDPLVEGTVTRKEEKITVNRTTNIQQTIVSLCILEKVEGSWQVHEPARLPRIEHDVAEDSVIVGKVHVEQDLQVDSNVAIGKTDEAGNITEGGNLTAKSIVVPYDTANNSIEGFPNTEIKDSGLYTAYVKAGSIETAGLAVGGAITITAPDSEDKDNDGDTEESLTLTTVSGDYISTVGYGRIDKYLNVGNPSEGTTTDGDIVAKNNITAEQDIITKNNLRVENNANIAEGLVVGSLEDSVENGTIKATAELEAPLVDATTEITTPKATISAGLFVQSGKLENPATAIIDDADITTADIQTLKGDDIQQKIGEGDGAPYYKVPVIFLKPKSEGAKTFYQLQISRVND